MIQQEIISLQNNLRHMIVGFNNISTEFPIANELTAKISEFYIYDCLDKFFNLTAPEELTLKGIIYFYLHTFSSPQPFSTNTSPLFSKTSRQTDA